MVASESEPIVDTASALQHNKVRRARFNFLIHLTDRRVLKMRVEGLETRWNLKVGRRGWNLKLGRRGERMVQQSIGGENE